jgi:hypothetical protein
MFAMSIVHGRDNGSVENRAVLLCGRIERWSPHSLHIVELLEIPSYRYDEIVKI